MTPLMFASRAGQSHLVKMLLNRKANKLVTNREVCFILLLPPRLTSACKPSTITCNGAHEAVHNALLH